MKNGDENMELEFCAMFGSALAIVISYTANKSIWWAILHGMFSWFFVIYAGITY